MDKLAVLDPQDISIVGFDIGVNEMDQGADARTGKWAWWHFDTDSGERKDSYDDERGWGKLELLPTDQIDTDVANWSLF